MSLNPVAIIGAGPAGLSAAIQLARYGLQPLLFEAGRVGGLLWNANWVENYPGFPHGLSGAQLAALFHEQLRRSQIEAIAERVELLQFCDDRRRTGSLFIVETDRRVYPSRCVVVASGTQPVRLEEIEIAPAAQSRVFYEVSQMPPCQGQRIAILGAGDAAFDYALHLAAANQALILNRGERLKCLPLLWQRAAALPQISYLPRCRLRAVRLRQDSPADGGLLADCEQDGEPRALEIDYLLCALGRVAQLDFMVGLSEAERAGLQTAGRLYFAGDVQNGLYRQTAIAVGQGVHTAMQIFHSLKETDR